MVRLEAGGRGQRSEDLGNSVKELVFILRTVGNHGRFQQDLQVVMFASD